VKHTPVDSPRRGELPDGWLAVGPRWRSWKPSSRDIPILLVRPTSLADIALYAYTHVAHEAHFDLTPYQAVRAWIDRVARQRAICR